MTAFITERQKKILETSVNDYIANARPVSSDRLFRRYNFGVCPATIRNEMYRLSEEKYLYQPYFSSGRIPTDKGYRIIVDEIIQGRKKKSPIKDEILEIIRSKQQSNTISFIQEIARTLAFLSSYLVLVYLLNEQVCFKEGWKKVLQEPEFSDFKVLRNFGRTVEELENNIDRLFVKEDNFLKVKVYIGRENLIGASKDFSLIISRSRLSRKKDIGLAILGPKRMTYDNNIRLLQFASEILTEF